jgi:hypothetical protein
MRLAKELSTLLCCVLHAELIAGNASKRYFCPDFRLLGLGFSQPDGHFSDRGSLHVGRLGAACRGLPAAYIFCKAMEFSVEK